MLQRLEYIRRLERRMIGRRDYDDEYSPKEVRAELMRLIRDPWHKSQMPVTVNGICRVTGDRKVNVLGFFRELKNEPAFPLTQRLGKIMAAVRERTLVFYQSDKIIKSQTGIAPMTFLWLKPPQPEPRLAAMVPEEEWSLFARCFLCLNNKFMPAKIGGRPHAVCYRCIPPSQYRALGVTLTKKSLIREALVKLGLV